MRAHESIKEEPSSSDLAKGSILFGIILRNRNITQRSGYTSSTRASPTKTLYVNGIALRPNATHITANPIKTGLHPYD
jgi:hypothetical protein